MVDLGTDIKDSIGEAYPSMGKREGKKSYPSICVPYKILAGKEAKIGEKIIVEVEGVVKAINQSENYSDIIVEIHEGEIESEEKEQKEESLLGEE